jgi:hypothetical protein
MRILLNKIKGEFKPFWTDLKDYASYFGPVESVFLSPYFIFSVLMTFIVFIFADEYVSWQAYAIDIVPDMLGFSIAGYAILISFGDDKFRKFLAKTKPNGSKHSLLLLLNGTFLHFIIIQVVSLFVAVIFKMLTVKSWVLNYAGCTVFLYAASFCIAVAFEIKTIGKWYQSYPKE